MRRITLYCGVLFFFGLLLDVVSTHWALSRSSGYVGYETNPLMFFTDQVLLIWVLAIVNILVMLWLFEKYFKTGWKSLAYLFGIIMTVFVRLVAVVGNVELALDPPSEEYTQKMISMDQDVVRVNNLVSYAKLLVNSVVLPFMVFFVCWLFGRTEWDVTNKV